MSTKVVCSLAACFLVGTLPLLAQAPTAPDPAFFAQTPKTLMVLCAEEARALMRPGDAHLWVEYGDIHLANGDQTKAKEAFARAISLNRDDPQTWHLVGLAWIRKGYKTEALTAYKAMTEIDFSRRYENRKNILTKAAVDLLNGGLIQEATAYMEQGYQLDKGDENNFLEFARAALFAGQRDLAAIYFARAVKAAPKDEDVWLEISDAFADFQTAQRTK